jgi:hypothetical protein
MNRIWGHAIAVSSLAVVVGALAPACAKNDETIFVRPVLAPANNRVNGACQYTNDPGQPINPDPTLDVAIRDNYFAILLVGNQLTPQADLDNARAESNRVHINGGVVKVTNPDGSDIVDGAGNVVGNFTSSATGMADPGSSATPGYGIIGLRVIDGPTAAALAATIGDQNLVRVEDTRTVLVNIKVFGKTLGGEDVESNDYQMPLTVCRGCLVTFPESSVDTAQPLPNCLKPISTAAGGGATQVPCFPGQDEATSCQFCAGRDACDPQKPGQP